MSLVVAQRLLETQLILGFSSLETTQLVLQTLLTLVSTNQGAKVLIDVEDASPLIEIAPSQPLVLDILLYAFSQTSMSAEDHLSLRNKVDQTVQALAVSFKGTDAVTLLSFLDQLLRRLDPEVCETYFPDKRAY